MMKPTKKKGHWTAKEEENMAALAFVLGGKVSAPYQIDPNTLQGRCLVYHQNHQGIMHCRPFPNGSMECMVTNKSQSHVECMPKKSYIAKFESP